MSHFDAFKPYSPDTRGDLEEYLREHDGHSADNLFRGSEYFIVIRDKGYLIPGVSVLRVDRSPAPDLGYFVNSNLMLESAGVGRQNMSMVGAEKGVYDPLTTLKNVSWSISGLNL